MWSSRSSATRCFEVREEGGGGAGWDEVFDVESEVEGQGSDLRRVL